MRVGWVVVLAGLTGCATVYRRNEFERVLALNASREMNCPVSQLSINPIGDQMIEGTDLPVQERVEGCRQREDYVAKAHGYERIPRHVDVRIDTRDLAQCGGGQ